jgi:hypothetical protein
MQTPSSYGTTTNHNTGTATATDTGENASNRAALSLSSYPSALSDTVKIVAPEEKSLALNRSVYVLKTHLQRETNKSLIVINYSDFDMGDESGSAIFLSPGGGNLNEIDRFSSSKQSWNRTSAVVTIQKHPGQPLNTTVTLNGGLWGIRASVDALTGRGEKSLTGSHDTITATLKSYNGKIKHGKYGPFYGLLFKTADDQYVITAPGKELKSKAPVNASIKSYETLFKFRSFQSNDGPTLITVPGVEVVNVTSLDTTEPEK